MRRRIVRRTGAYVIAGAMLILASCSSSSDVQIIADWETGTFTASGNASTCAEGQQSERDTGPPTDNAEAAPVEYDFVCADGTGTFTFSVEFEPLTEAQEQGSEEIEMFSGTWTLVEGTGEYDHTEGSGTVVVDFTGGTTELSAIATYDGDMSG